MSERERRGTAKIISRRNPKRLMKGISFLLACGAILAIVVYSPLFSVRKINVTGNSCIAQEDVCRAAGVYPGEPLFRLETTAVAKRLMKDLRIEQASVRRVMPYTLDIQIKERMPVATVACEYGYLDLDREGRVVDAYRTLKNMAIPMITGIALHDMYVGDTTDDETVKQILFFLQQLDEDSLNQISEVSAASPEHITAYTTSAEQIRLGGLDRLEEKATLTKDFLLSLKTARHPIEFVDFTYTSPFIRFKDAVAE